MKSGRKHVDNPLGFVKLSFHNANSNPYAKKCAILILDNLLGDFSTVFRSATMGAAHPGPNFYFLSRLAGADNYFKNVIGGR